MTRRALLSVCLCVLCCSTGSAQQGTGAMARSGISRAPITIDGEDTSSSIRGRQRIHMPGEFVKPERPDIYVNKPQSVLNPKFRVGHDPSADHGVAEAHANAVLKALKIPVAAPLGTNILVPGASEAECDKSQIAFGSVVDENQDNIKKWGQAFNRSSILDKGILTELIKDGKSGLLNLMSEYSEKCLSDVARLRQDSPLMKSLSLTMGVLFVNNSKDKLDHAWGTICSATRIGLNLVLTAKHCFYNLEDGEVAIAAETLADVKNGRYKFTLPMLERDLLVVSIECVADQATDPYCRRFGPAGPRNAGFGADFVLLRVRNGDDLPMPDITVSSKGIKQGSAVMLVGWNLFAGIVDAYRQSLASSGNVKVSPPLRLSRAGTCTIATVNNICMVHTCQSSSGASGASLIQFEADGALRIVGLHVAPTDSLHTYMGKESCDLDLFRIHDLYRNSKQRYAGNIGLQLAP